MRFFDYLLPRYCHHCAQPIKQSQIPNLCTHCSQAIQPALQKCIFCDTDGGFLCHFCKRLYPYLVDVIICYQYTGLIKRLIKSFKYQLKPYLSTTLATLIEQHIGDYLQQLPPNTLIIPMPSDRIRVAQRGFNPPALVAKILANKLRLSYNDRILEKRAFSLPQAHLSFEERLHNHYNSFILNHKALSQFHRGESNPLTPLTPLSTSTDSPILFIDDVITTGNSFQRAMEILNDPHPKNVYALFIAQSPFEK